MINTEAIKKMVGEYASELVADGMTIGLGTGSTARHLIITLAERFKKGLNIRCVPTSVSTKQLAEEMGIPLLELNEATNIDLALDGADEISSNLDLIKGGGGALLQEKMVAFAARKFIVMADETKMVQQPGNFPLPVEVVQYGWKKTGEHIKKLGCKLVSVRTHNEKIFVTDHGQFILDCHFENIIDPAALNVQIKSIPGVVETGLFVNMAHEAIVGYADGTIKVINRK